MFDDFVNRNNELERLKQVADRLAELSVVLVTGEDGMGKSYLLQEFPHKLTDQEAAFVLVDFTEKGFGKEYSDVILKLAAALGKTYQDTINQTIADINRKVAEQLVQDLLQATQAGGTAPAVAPQGAPPGPAPAGEGPPHQPVTVTDLTPQPAAETPASPPLPEGPVSRDVQASNQGTPTHIHQETELEVGSIEAGANIKINPVYLYQANLLQREDPLVQNWAKAELTSAFKNCLTQFSGQRKLVISFDNWGEAFSDTQTWVENNLLTWVLEGSLPQVSLFITNPNPPNLEKARGHAWLVKLKELSKDAVREYWVEKWKLPEDMLDEVWNSSEGEPRLLYLIARRHKKDEPEEGGGLWTG